MLQKLRTRFASIKLSRKIALCLALAVFLFLVVALAAFEWSFNIYDKMLFEKSLLELDFFSREVDSTLEDVDTFTKRIALDADIQQELILAAEQPYPSGEYSFHIQNIRSLVFNEMLSYPNVRNVAYLDKGSIQSLIGSYTGTLSSEELNGLIAAFDRAAGAYVYIAPSERYPYLLSGRSILQVKDVSLSNLGAFAVSTDLGAILDRQRKGLEAAHSTLIVIADGHIIYGPDGADTEAFIPSLSGRSGYRILQLRGEKTFLCYTTSQVTGWKYINLFPYSDVFYSSQVVRISVLLCFLLLAAVLILLSRRIAGSVTKPLEELTSSITLLENGRFQEAKEILHLEERQDEVGELTREYSSMLDRMDDLIYENYEKQLLLKDTKYRMLQAQINPHFIYNTLNTLNWMVRAGRREDSVKMILSLGQLLRATFGKETLVTVEEEVRMAENYMVIQQYRYQNRAKFQLETEGELDRYQIPNMLLQPLIENALLYGVDESAAPCTVTVRAVEQENGILLEVSDNGGGMTEEELAAVRTLTAKPKGHGIGLKNIHERLKLSFGEFDFQVDSEKGKGTDIRIVVPKREVTGHD